jgi:two-component system sensor histidine kinase TctE
MTKAPVSLRRRLVLQLLALAAVLAVLLYVTVRTVADQAAEATQDAVLGAATLAIAEQLRVGDDGVELDLPYEAFSILGSISEDRIFYRIDVDGQTVTGYDDLPLPDMAKATVTPVFSTAAFRDTSVRIAAVGRTVLVNRKPAPVRVLVAQTRQGQEAIAQKVANRAAGLGLGFFVVAAVLSLLTAASALRPIERLADAVGRRGPHDLRAVDHPTPLELKPLVTALNGFIARLRTALNRTETFITEAAHHIRTPLATVRARSEIALRQTEDPELRETLRAVIRSVEESSRSAGQLLEHATVIYRSDRREDEEVDLARLVEASVRSLRPTAELRDLDLTLSGTDHPVMVRGDAMLLESAIRNLIDNAIKYSPDESEVSLDLTSDDAGHTLQIADRGPGLGGQAKSTLIKRFQRGSNTANVVGSGLGLTIVEEVAVAHGGRFDLTERKGGGACARLFLPSG